MGFGDAGQVRAWKIINWGEMFNVDVPLDRTMADEYDALHCPAG